ncbi:MAG: hypothetical protein IPK16_28560 [Anaerolineales bacterium]|nr:hypothetical protein [Anaerolineales bacterium]
MSITMGAEHTCAVLESGHIKCWGRNTHGQLGNATTNSSSVPVDVDNIQRAGAISAGDLYTCAQLADATLKCWGDNSRYQLGDGTLDPVSTTPVAVAGLDRPVAAVATGSNHACAVMDDGSMSCWGWGFYGQLGDGTDNSRNLPVTVADLPAAVIDAVAGTWHTCALLINGAVYCWGLNIRGQIGDGDTFGQYNAPIAVPELTQGVMAIAANAADTCAVLADGAAICWGDNTYGQRGNGDATGRTRPAAVAGLDSAQLRWRAVSFIAVQD